MPESRSARHFPWFGDVSAVGPFGKTGVSLMLLGMIAGFGTLLLWPTGPKEFAALQAALSVPNALLVVSTSLSALGAVLYLMGYARAVIRWAMPRPGPSLTSGRAPEDA
jgi:hypothetical protein